jgi:protein-tyrosine phosphatase
LPQRFPEVYAVFEVLTVCTGNICRSPLAAEILRARLAPLDAVVTSAGTSGIRDAPMTSEAQLIAVQYGVTADAAASHRSRYLLENHLASPDLILTMTRDQRRHVAELAPARLRSTFTAREFARLAAEVSDDDLRAAVESAPDASRRVRAAAALVASRRGHGLARAGSDDDVIDPFRRSWDTYERSAAQLVPALDEVVRVLRIAAG